MRYAFLLFLAFAALGCNASAPLEFKPNRLVMLDHELTTPHQEQIEQVMTDLFGGSDEPHAPAVTELDIAKLRRAAGPAGYEKHADGEEYLQRGLYRQHCAACHGVTGDGYGPAAGALAPFPRDFRPGKFKFKSTWHAAKPTDDDLRHTIVAGIPGTAMPAFAMLDEEQVDALVEYVKYLSMRGQVERELISSVADEFAADLPHDSTDDPLDPQRDSGDEKLISDVVRTIADRWIHAAEETVRPDPQFIPAHDRAPAEVAKSIAAGERVFLSAAAKCTECHGASGQGDGLKDLDDWSRENYDFRRETAALAETLESRREKLRELPGGARARGLEQWKAEERQLRARQQVVEQLLEPQFAWPRNFERGVFRGGSEPIDLFRRIHEGIPGTPMPAHGSPRTGVAGALSDSEIWQLVDYLRSRKSGGESL